MSKTKNMKVPKEFDDFIDNLSIQVSKELGLPKNKSQTMRLLATHYRDKIIFRGKKCDTRIF